jgi:hypothetical protein
MTLSITLIVSCNLSKYENCIRINVQGLSEYYNCLQQMFSDFRLTL